MMGLLRGRKVFYGWWIVVASTLGAALGGWVFAYGVGAFFMPLVNEFGWSRAALSGALSLARLEGGLSGPLEGMLIDRFGPKVMMLTGVILMGLGYGLLSQVNSLVAYYIFFIGFLALGASFATGTSLYTAVAYWFVRKRGLAMGIMNAGWGLGGAAVPLLALLIATVGWRSTFLIAAVTIWVLGIPLAMVMRGQPEKYGLLPDGDTPSTELTPSTRRLPRFLKFVWAVPRREVDFTAPQAVRSRAFWMLSLVWGGRMFITGSMNLHLIPLFEDVGFGPELAATVLGILTMTSVAGRFGFGWLADVFDKRYVLAFCYATMALALVVLLDVRTFWQAMVFVLLYAPAYGGTATPTHSLRGELFGRKSFASIHGLFLFTAMWATIGGPIFAGYTFDVTRSYHVALVTFIAMSAVISILVLLIGHPKPSPKLAAGGKATRDD
ncbi:MAG: MFS transporter [Chloroflexi bacterium]|nr:MFS transporter [Chloroflexota bacterium]